MQKAYRWLGLGGALAMGAAACGISEDETLRWICLERAQQTGLALEPAVDDRTGTLWTDGGERAALTTIAEDGAWCWFQDERAIFAGDRLVVGSVSGAGDVQVSSYDPATAAADHFVLSPAFDRDDHAAPALQQLADGRIRAYYTKHTGSHRIYQQVSDGRDGDISAWSEADWFTGAPDDTVCYANVLPLAAESDGDSERVYLFFRGLNYNPTFMVSNDGGASWSGRTQLLHSWEPGGPKNGNHRPYVKYVSDGVDTIHFLYTEGHPDECDVGTNCVANSVYHMYYRNGGLYRSNGELIAPMASAEDVAIDPTLGTLVYDGQCGAHGEAWVWDLALDQQGQPVAVFASFPDRDDVGSSHVYHWARWDGSQWQRRVVAHAGTGLYSGQAFYSGGIAIDPNDTDTVYFSSDVNPTNRLAIGTGRYEIYRARAMDDDARTWQITAVTESSAVDNLRPVVPNDHPFATAVLWMRGDYQSYTDYDTQIVGLLGSADVVVGADR